MPKAIIYRFVMGLATVLILTACARTHSVQVRPPIAVPAGFVSGYGVEKISAGAARARQSAYLKAMDELLTNSGPVIVSKTVQDETSVVGLRPANRTLETSFRLRASRILQPTFRRAGVDHGFVWVLVAISQDEMERGWEDFVAWRNQRINEAAELFRQAKGTQRAEFLRASLSLLDEAGAADDPDMLYYQVKAALDAEDKFEQQFRDLIENGYLDRAEAVLEEAQRAGLDSAIYNSRQAELEERRAQALRLIQAGDELLQAEKYKEARIRYEQARRIDRNNSLVEGKIAMTDRFEHETHSRHVQETVGFVVPAATRTVSEYFAFKREQERRKAEEERRKREEAEREAQEKENQRRRRRN